MSCSILFQILKVATSGSLKKSYKIDRGQGLIEKNNLGVGNVNMSTTRDTFYKAIIHCCIDFLQYIQE